MSHFSSIDSIHDTKGFPHAQCEHTYAAFPLNQEVVTALSQWTAQPAVAKISSISVLHFLTRVTCFLSSTARQQKRFWQKGRWAAWWIMQNIIYIAPYNKFDYLKLWRSFDTHFAVGLWIVVVGGFQDLQRFFWKSFSAGNDWNLSIGLNNSDERLIPPPCNVTARM